MNKVQSTLTSPLFWKTAFGAGCCITSIVLLILGFQSVHFGHFSIHLHFYNTLAAFDLIKTTGYLVGAGALAGLSAFAFKNVARDKILPKILQKQEEYPFIKKAVRAVRSFYPILSIIAIVTGILLIGGALLYISYFMQHQPTLIAHVQQYLANEQLLKAIMVGIVFGGFLISLGILEAAQHLSNNKISVVKEIK